MNKIKQKYILLCLLIMMVFMTSCSNASEVFQEIKEYSDGYSAVKKNDQWGYIDLKKNMIIEPQFLNAGNFHNGYSVVQTKKDWQIINESGRMIYSTNEKSLRIMTLDIGRDDVVLFTENKNMGAIIEDQLISPEYTVVTPIEKTSFFALKDNEEHFINLDYNIDKIFEQVIGGNNNMILVKDKGLYGYINNKGEFTIPPTFTLARIFDSGLAPALKDSKYGYINTEGKFEISPEFLTASPFSNGKAQVQTEFDGSTAKYGYIDTEGELIYEKECDILGPINEGFVFNLHSVDSKWQIVELSSGESTEYVFDQISKYENDRSILQKNGKYGILSDSFQRIVPFSYDKIVSMDNNNTFIVTRNQKQGVINSKGKIIIPIEFDKIYLTNEFYRSTSKEKKHYYSKSGNLIIDMNEFQEADQLFKGKYITVMRNDKWGIINYEGEIVKPFNYEKIKILNSNKVAIYESNKNGWRIEEI